MVDAWIPYGKTEVCARIPTRNFLGSIEPKQKNGVEDSRSEIERALNNPIGTKKLSDIAKAGDKVAIVVNDATRPTPSHLMLVPLLDELNKAGVNDSDVTLRLERTGDLGPSELRLPANSHVRIKVKLPESGDQPVLQYTAANLLIAPGEGLPVTLRLPVKP